MVKRLIGYLLSLMGLVFLTMGLVPNVKNSIKIFTAIPHMYVLIIGVVLILAGILIVRKPSSLKEVEVPIYKGKKIVGYRRH